MNVTALIAEDEPLLAGHLQRELAALWPELGIAAVVGHGRAAVDAGLTLRPDVVFLDVRMPGMTGIEAAQELAEEWPHDVSLPLTVFVTAYDEYALKAFELAAVDYVLKPVRSERLAVTCDRLKAALSQRTSVTGTPGAAGSGDATLERLRALLEATAQQAAPVPKLTVIQASAGAAIHLVPIGDVVYFEAADKYVRVVTADREHLIRISLRDLLPQLDLQRFWQVHRGTVVRADAIASAQRDDAGKLTLTLRGHADRLNVSRLYANRFKGM